MTDDEQEAESIKYNVARIVRLSSGNFALFSAFDNDDGIRLIHIGDLNSLEPFIPTAAECEVAIRSIRDSETVTDLTEGHNLLQALGLATKPEPLKRRDV